MGEIHISHMSDKIMGLGGYPTLNGINRLLRFVWTVLMEHVYTYACKYTGVATALFTTLYGDCFAHTLRWG